MCGIAGIWDSQKRGRDVSKIREMTATLKHRGPDDSGIWNEGALALGHQRLSIIDLITGHQPMFSESRATTIVYNGEIYNYRELREELMKRGCRFRTHSDTEVVLYLYEIYGERCLDYLRGMFAFTIWDQKRERIFCARDRFGQKPLFYAFVDGVFLFASELEALFKSGHLEKKVSEAALGEYLTYGYVLHPKTIYEKVHKLEPGYQLIVTKEGLSKRAYWNLQDQPSLSIRSEEEALSLFSEKFERAVKLRMMSDVPLGAFLSGGLDSTAIVSVLSKLSAAPVKTFSIGFEESAYNELEKARRVAQHFGTQHEELLVHPDKTAVLPDLAHQLGEPFADASLLPMYYVSKLAHGHVKVALSGDGADEAMLGYDRYLAAKWAESLAPWIQKIPQGIWEKTMHRFGQGRDDRDAFARLVRFLKPARMTSLERYQSWMQLFSKTERRRLFRTQSDVDQDVLHHYFFSKGKGSLLQRLSYLDLQTYLPGDLLVKVDIASMHHSLEVRSPFLDHELVSFLWQLQTNFKLKGRFSKYLLRRYLEGRVPNSILKQKKRGFGVPTRKWLREDLRDTVQEALLDPASFSSQLFDRSILEKFIQEHLQGKQNHDKKLWALLMLEFWNQTCYQKSKVTV